MRQMLFVSLGVFIFICSFDVFSQDQDIPMYVFIKGSLNDYANQDIIYSQRISASMTSGIKGEIVERVGKIETNLMSVIKNNAASVCAKLSAKSYAVDNFDMQISPIGEYNNMLGYATANAVCIK